MNPKVTVILTSYNRPQLLAEAIDSVVAQTFTDWELLVMDDKSGPEVYQVLANYLKDPRIITFNSHVSDEDRYATARYATLINLAFRNATGQYLTYLVDDDKYYPDRLQVMVDYMDAHPDHEVVYHALENIDMDGNPGGIRGVKGILDGETEETQAFNYVDHNAVMHTRQAFKDARGWYDVPGVWGGADAYFWRRLNEAGYKFYPVGDNDHPLGAKRYHLNNLQRLIVEGEFYAQDRQNKDLPPL
jgi:spore maturation protein CgeD